MGISLHDMDEYLSLTTIILIPDKPDNVLITNTISVNQDFKFLSGNPTRPDKMVLQ
jgi:hypothetical protein